MISNFDYVLLSIWEEYIEHPDEVDKKIKSKNLNIDTKEYNNILKELDEKGFVNGITFAGNKNHTITWLDNIQLTDQALEYIAEIGKENKEKSENEIGYEKTTKNIDIKRLLKKVYDEAKDIGTTIAAKCINENNKI